MKWTANVQVCAGALSIDVELAGDERPIALVGPNGSGKTTLLRAIAGAHRPMTGEVVVGDHVLFSTARSVDVPTEQRRLAYVPQGYGLFPHLRVVDNVAFGLSTGSGRRTRSARRALAIQALEELDCGHLAQRLPAKLSGGEQQRVSLARALVTAPQMLLLDEPLAALDVSSRRSVRAFLGRRLQALQRPSIVVTHDVRDVVALAATIWVIDAGQIVQCGDLAALAAAPANDFVAEFVDTRSHHPSTEFAEIAV